MNGQLDIARTGIFTTTYGGYHHLRDVAGQPVKASRNHDSRVVSVGTEELKERRATALSYWLISVTSLPAPPPSVSPSPSRYPILGSLKM